MRVAPNAVVRIAWLVIITHGIGVLANGFGLAFQHPDYPQTIWATFMLLKLTGTIGGMKMLEMRRSGVWLVTGSMLTGAVVAMIFTGPHAFWQWLGAASILAMVLTVGWKVLHPHWHLFAGGRLPEGRYADA